MHGLNVGKCGHITGTERFEKAALKLLVAVVGGLGLETKGSLKTVFFTAKSALSGTTTAFSMNPVVTLSRC
jgi:hypothetical protein